MQLNDIFNIDKYAQAYEYVIQNGYTIKEIEKNLNGERQFKIVDIPTPSETDKLQNEINELKNWFNTYYTEHEQKYRRLITLNKADDDEVDGQTKLITLYEEAEQKRARIQELEVRIQKLELKKALSTNS